MENVVDSAIENNVIHINDILGSTTGVKHISTGSELLLAYELNKYLKLLLGKKLSMDGMKISKELLKGPIFSFVVYSGLDVGCVVDVDSLVSFKGTLPMYFLDTAENVYFEEQTPECWKYSLESDITRNNKLNKSSKSAAYISIIAYMLVTSYIDGVKCPKLLINHKKHAQLELEYVHLLILRNWGNKLLLNLVDIEFAEGSKLQPDWEAFVILHRQLGLMDKAYSLVEKNRLIKRKFAVGDVVLLYTKHKATGGGAGIGKLKNCYPGVIRDITKETISIDYIPQIDTKLTREIALDQLNESFDDTVFTMEDYNRFLITSEVYETQYIGIDDYSYKEKTFITEPVESDGSFQFFRLGDKIVQKWLPTYDTIYAVLEDRGIDYNKERFLAKYFPNSVPYLDQIRNMSEDELFNLTNSF